MKIIRKENLKSFNKFKMTLLKTQTFLNNKKNIKAFLMMIIKLIHPLFKIKK